MKIDRFLHFWNGHNDTIIEVLVAVVLLLVIYLAFRHFFGPETTEGTSATSQIDTQEIEKTLQKILDAQSKAPVSFPNGATGDSAPLDSAGASQSGTIAELETLKAELAEKERLLAEAREEATKVAALAAQPASPAASVDTSKLDSKIKDLEARLAEYEIISEDIADLSFYKEENIRLQNELAALKAGGAAPASTPAAGDSTPSSTPTSSEPASAAPEATTEPVAANPVESPSEAPAAKPASEGGSADSTATETKPAAADSSTDESATNSSGEDDIMKEFAKAVEEQKAAPTTSAPPPPAKTDAQENSELMNQFENFVKKT